MLLFIALLIREKNRSNKSAVFCENFMLLTFFNIITQDLLNKKKKLFMRGNKVKRLIFFKTKRIHNQFLITHLKSL